MVNIVIPAASLAKNEQKAISCTSNQWRMRDWLVITIRSCIHTVEHWFTLT